MSWYRKHRPISVGQLDMSSVKKTFSRMLADGKIPQVMLFSGPKGTGKTSSARIIASVLNDPQNSELVDHRFFGKSEAEKKSYSDPNIEDELVSKIHSGQSFVVHELDAASNRGIDDIRALKERVSLPPAQGRISVFILDEVHMLTTEAFNALLKMLEEPPNHSVFILATTEQHKIPPTVLSRCTTIRFQKATTLEIMDSLKRVAKLEQLKASDEIFELIANFADGSFRDAVKLLESLTPPDRQLKIDEVKEQLRVVEASSVQQLLEAVIGKNEKSVIDIFAELRSLQVNEKVFFKQLLVFLYDQLKICLDVEPGKSFANQQVVSFLLKKLLQTQLSFSGPIPFLGLEVVFLEMIHKSKQQKTNDSGTKIVKKNSSSSLKNKNTPSLRVQSNGNSLDKSVMSGDELEPVSPGDADLLLNSWGNFIQAVSEKQSVVAMLLRTAKPIRTENNEAIIGVYYPFHKERLEDESTQKLLEQCVAPFVGGRVKLNFALANQAGDVGTAAVYQASDELPELAKEALL